MEVEVENEPVWIQFNFPDCSAKWLDCQSGSLLLFSLLTVFTFSFFFFLFCILHQDLDKVSFLMAISQTDFGKSLVKPRIKVGREFVNQGRNLQQVTCLLLKCFSLRTKSLYKLFRFKYYSFQLVGCIPFLNQKITYSNIILVQYRFNTPSVLSARPSMKGCFCGLLKE